LGVKKEEELNAETLRAQRRIMSIFQDECGIVAEAAEFL